MPLSRRSFLGRAAALPLVLGAGAGARVMLPGGALAAPAAAPYTGRTLVLIELGGGNDGLNTVVPYADPLYAAARPTLGLSEAQVLPIGQGLGLNGKLDPLLPLWQRGQMAVVLGVGYPQPNRSHFRSIEIWDTASRSDEDRSDGWAAQVFAKAPVPSSMAAWGLAVGEELGPMQGLETRVAVLDPNPAMLTIGARDETGDNGMAGDNAALRHLRAVRSDLSAIGKALDAGMDRGDLGVTFPKSHFGASLEMAARILRGREEVPLIKVTQGGYDTHTGEATRHPKQMEDLGKGLAAFAATLEARGLWDKVLIMTYGEFGRRVAENASGGTDHGTAAPHFVLGGGVKGGLVGRQPALDDLDAGDLKFTTDFRSLYATAARNWWGVKGAFADFAPLPLLA